MLQHFPKAAARSTLAEIRRVMVAGGESRQHLLNAYGLRSLQVQIARGFRAARDFEVRYWRPGEMLRAFDDALGPSHLEIDGFFMQAREEDRELLTANGRRLLSASRALTKLANRLPPLAHLADNLVVVSDVGDGTYHPPP